ncbi:DUF4139 domain-containing protein [Xanthocytophaga flava]|uniref:DUF4139 domain-containing protein n=1 Tax=Xanthocytophaga flava TaxID=3048013 RepID=UPI0028D322E9|nr:DUF4139 domain-containing protein [Xanthocytophaga flavus]MDJ1473249.1 DUF4139 domain-containing protein [Xanthocytophaga flavus]
MKKIVFLLFLLSTYYLTQAQQPQSIQTESRIEEVTVYLDGAEIKNSQAIRLIKGKNTINFKGLSPFLEERSIQITPKGEVEILSISTGTRTITPEEVDLRIKRQTDSIKILQQQIELVTNQIDAYNTEKKLLSENQKLGGKESGTTITELMKAADFYRDRTLKINNSLTTLNIQLKSLSVSLDSVSKQSEHLKTQIDTRRKEINLVVSSATEQRVEFEIRYIVHNAGWEATYDLIATDISKPVSLKYNARIYNGTGIDWKDVKLTLSTADPSLEASRPYLSTWILNYNSGANEGLVQNQLFNQQNWSAKEEGSSGDEGITVSELAATFKIDKVHTIPTNKDSYQIHISDHNLNALYEYLTIPKVDMSAFLLAKVTGWKQLNLIDGKANVYFGNTYIGESNINTQLLGDTLDLSLGRDNQVIVKRTKVEDFAANKSIGGKKSEALVYEISIRNNRPTPLQIKIQDQVPISQESDISVDTDEISGAELDTPSGRLQWKRQISPGEIVKYKIAFTVKYPKNKTISLRKSRTVRTPRLH